MRLSALWMNSWTMALTNHLWQSTLVVGIAWTLALVLRSNHARTRYWVWMAASTKFIVPFSLFVAAGERLRSIMTPLMETPALTATLSQVTEPFSQIQFFPAAATHPAFQASDWVTPILVSLWAFGSAVVALSWLGKWRQIRTAMLGATPQSIRAGVPVLSSQSLLEPGVFGILRPVLLLPEGILDRLTGAQLEAILAHEMFHVRRLDNLTFAFHMLVETLFWFHPLVWWIQGRLVEERELACDEAVLQSGNDAEAYAEGILNVCKFYVESPLACAAGVSGADLKKRVARIMTEQVGRNLSWTQKLVLCIAGLFSVMMPVAFGLSHVGVGKTEFQVNPKDVKLPAFEVASIKPNKASDDRMMFMMTPDGLSATGTPMGMILRQAFGVEDDRIFGKPGWVQQDKFDVQAKVEAADAPTLKKLTPDQRFSMLLPVLEERLNLKYHHETREMPVYMLVTARGGTKLKPTAPDVPNAAIAQGANSGPMRHSLLLNDPGHLESRGTNLDLLVHELSQTLGRTVINKTGLTGNYDYTLSWTPENGPPTDTTGPSLFTAIQEQLGLRLEAEKEPVEVVVIDHIDKPSAN
jgi:bla regulator protein BlaR1